METMFRQGDVLIVRCSSVPSAATRQENNVLAYGKVTGHAHVATGDVTVYRTRADAADAWLRVGSGGATVTHHEHGAIRLEPGEYAIRRQREYTPSEIRRVAD